MTTTDRAPKTTIYLTPDENTPDGREAFLAYLASFAKEALGEGVEIKEVPHLAPHQREHLTIVQDAWDQWCAMPADVRATWAD